MRLFWVLVVATTIEATTIEGRELQWWRGRRRQSDRRRRSSKCSNERSCTRCDSAGCTWAEAKGKNGDCVDKCPFVPDDSSKGVCYGGELSCRERCRETDDLCPVSMCSIGPGCNLVDSDRYLVDGICCPEEPCKTKCEPPKTFDSCTECAATGFTWISSSKSDGRGYSRGYCSEQCPAPVNGSSPSVECFTSVATCPPERCGRESADCPTPAVLCEAPPAGCVADKRPPLWTTAPDHDTCCPEPCATECKPAWQFYECSECTEIGYAWISGKCVSACPELGSGETASAKCLDRDTSAQCPPRYSVCRRERDCATCGAAGCSWLGDSERGRCVSECREGDGCTAPADKCPPRKCRIESSSGCPVPRCEQLQPGCEFVDGDLFEDGELCCRAPCETKCKPARSFGSCTECSATGFAWAFKGSRTKCIDQCPEVGSGDFIAPERIAPEALERIAPEAPERIAPEAPGRSLGNSRRRSDWDSFDGCVEGGMSETCPPERCGRESKNCPLPVCLPLEDSTCKYTKGELFVTGDACCPEPCATSCQCDVKSGWCPPMDGGCNEPITEVPSICTLKETVLYDRPDGACCPEPCQFECIPIVPEPIPSTGVQVLYGGSTTTKMAFCLDDSMASVTSAATAGAEIDTGNNGATRPTIAAQCCYKDHSAGKQQGCIRYGGSSSTRRRSKYSCVGGVSSRRKGKGPDFYNVKATTYASNVAMCAKLGAKMGKELELCNWSCADTGCNYNSHLTLSSLPCKEPSSGDDQGTVEPPQGAAIPATGIQVIRGDKKGATELFCLKPGMETVTELPQGVGGVKKTAIAAQCCALGHASKDFKGERAMKCRRGTKKGRRGSYDGDCISGVSGLDFSPMTYAENVKKCDDLGLEMCTISCADTGCYYNRHGVYSSIPCDE